MEQFRQLSEAMGSINALMAFESELRINPRQCRLLADACAHALAAVTGEVRAHLRFEERGAKWRALEPPLRELHRAFRDVEGYVRKCLDPRGSWWARAAAVAHGTECVEQHLHGILWCVTVAIEAVEAAGSDADEVTRRRLVIAKKYGRDMLEPRLFQNAHGKLYLVSPEFVTRMDSAWKEDRWILSQLLDEMKSPAAPKPLSMNERRLANVLTAPRGTLHPASILLRDYSVRRRLGGRLKEAQWMGETFAVKHFIGDGEREVALLSSVAHPNVAHAAYCFHDEDRKEYFAVLDQLMAKDLGSYVKDVCGPGRRVPFPLVVAVDVMLQIARGMEYLHGKKMYHGELNPCNVLVKPRQPDGYVHVKVAGYGRSGTVTTRAKASADGHANANANGGGENAYIWYAPEVLDQDGAATVKCTEKADVYSFSMICFGLLTGKVPFEDNHLQGDKTSGNGTVRVQDRGEGEDRRRARQGQGLRLGHRRELGARRGERGRGFVAGRRVLGFERNRAIAAGEQRRQEDSGQEGRRQDAEANRVSSEGEAGERGDVSADGKSTNYRREARISGSTADFRTLLGIGGSGACRGAF